MLLDRQILSTTNLSLLVKYALINFMLVAISNSFLKVGPPQSGPTKSGPTICRSGPTSGPTTVVQWAHYLYRGSVGPLSWSSGPTREWAY